MLDLSSISTSDAVLRLGLAVLFGSLLGLNRNLHGKPAGLRTHALVALGAALVMMVALRLEHPLISQETKLNFLVEYNAISRVMQGILQGIGFLGAGIILHSEAKMKVHGLTTAASVWIASLIGIGCGVAAWSITTIAFLLAMGVLIAGGPIEKAVHKMLGVAKEEEEA